MVMLEIQALLSLVNHLLLSRLITIGAIWSFHANNLTCEDAQLLHWYLGGVLVTVMLILVVTLLLARTSMRGPLMDTRARKNVPKLVYIR